MTTFANLTKSVHEAHHALESVRRHYAVGDRLIACLSLYSERRRRRREHPGFRHVITDTPPLEIHVVTNFELQDKEGDFFDLSECTARELIAFAEVQGTIEKWKNGDLLELPPSNAIPYKPTDE